MTANGGNTRNKVFDLDAARAARREAEGEGFRFVWNGVDFVCAPAKEWPIAVNGALSNGDIEGALLGILGDEQGPVFLAGKPTMGDVETLMTEIAKYSGVDGLGE
jgi:hypothetical protein